MVCNSMAIGEVWLGERWNAPLPSSSQLIRLHGPAELPEYIYPRITEPSLHDSLALASLLHSPTSHTCALPLFCFGRIHCTSWDAVCQLEVLKYLVTPRCCGCLVLVVDMKYMIAIYSPLSARCHHNSPRLRSPAAR